MGRRACPNTAYAAKRKTLAILHAYNHNFAACTSRVSLHYYFRFFITISELFLIDYHVTRIGGWGGEIAGGKSAKQAKRSGDRACVAESREMQ